MELISAVEVYNDLVNREATGTESVNANSVKVNRLDEEFVQKGAVVTIPDFGEDFIYPLIKGDRGGQYFISQEGIKVWCSMLQRGAKDINTGEYISPSGDAVAECQNYSNWQDFLSANRGKQLHFVDYQEVNNGYPKPRKVWQIDFVVPQTTTRPSRARNSNH